MRRINTATARSGRFVNGNKTTGAKATQFNAEWSNGVQEEIANLIEASGLSLDGSEDQLKRIFTVLYVLEARLKSLALQKSFSGGYSKTEINGENLKMFADGDSVTDDTSLELSRLLLRFLMTVSNGKVALDVEPLGFSFKCGNDDSLNQCASITFDPTTGGIVISSLGGIVCSGKIHALSDIEGDVYTDFINPTEERKTVSIGSNLGGVRLRGQVSVSGELEAVNVPKDFVDVSDLDLTDTDVVHALLSENLWTEGQVKRFLNNTSSVKSMPIYTDSSGTFRNVSLPSTCYVTFVCAGFYTNPYRNNDKYAILVQGA